MPTPLEIERKFLVRNFDMSQIPPGSKSYEVKPQTYLLNIPNRPGIECRVRRKITEGGVTHYYTEKTPTQTQGVKGEFEEPITEAKYDEYIRLYADPKCTPVVKTRFKIPYESSMIELDIYREHLDGLVTFEVEFTSEESMRAFTPPPFFSFIEVTGDNRYSNRQLSEFGIPR